MARMHGGGLHSNTKLSLFNAFVFVSRLNGGATRVYLLKSTWSYVVQMP